MRILERDPIQDHAQGILPFFHVKVAWNRPGLSMVLDKQTDLLHRFWQCPPIAIFWSSVIRFVTSVTQFCLMLEPTLLIFGCPPHTEPYSSTYTRLPQSTRHWILLALLTARRTILQHWIASSPPSIATVIKELKALLHKENLDIFSTPSYSKVKFEQRWSTFIKIHLSTSEQNTLSSGSFVFLNPDLTSKPPTQGLSS